jgi:dihydroxyacid dehydratase/phosphogluconate dehydratase
LKLRKHCLTWPAQNIAAHRKCCAIIAVVGGTIDHAHFNAGAVHLRCKSSASASQSCSENKRRDNKAKAAAHFSILSATNCRGKRRAPIHFFLIAAKVTWL